MGPRTAAALIIGNELLSGKIAETNLVVLARTLRAIGTKLCRVVMVLDERRTIAAEVLALSTSHDVLFTSGGMGPTHDDVTPEAVADAFGVDLVESPQLAALIRAYFGARLRDGHLQMARIPRGARLITGPEQPFPTLVMQNVWLLPGVPQLFTAKMAVISAELGGADSAYVSVELLTKLDEGTLKPLLDQVVAAHPEIEVGSYPEWSGAGYHTKVTFDGQRRCDVDRARAALVVMLPEGSLIEP